MSKSVACRLRARNTLLRQNRVIENVKYCTHGCVDLLVVGWLMAYVPIL